MLALNVAKKASFLLSVSTVVFALAACAAPATPAPTQVPATEAPTVEVPATSAPTQVPATEVPTTEAPATLAPGALPEVDAMAVTGDIVAAGSSTVYPLTEAIALQLKDEGFAGEIKIDSIGSGAGLERFCKTGEIDIATASRHIKDEEVANCAAIGRTPIEFRVGTDALVVVVSSENEFASDLTMEQLGKVFSGEAKTWADIDPAWPAEEIQRFSPGTDSGTFDYFVEVVFKKDKEKILNAPNLQLSEDDNVLVQGVEGSPYAIGFFGYAYYQENASKLKTVSIDGVAPSFDTAEDGSYPISRPLYLYSDAGIMTEKPQVAAFINYFLTNVNDLIGDVGYFPASDDALQVSRDNWLAATGAQ